MSLVISKKDEIQTRKIIKLLHLILFPSFHELKTHQMFLRTVSYLNKMLINVSIKIF